MQFDSIIQKIQARLPDAKIEIDGKKMSIDGMLVKHSWVDEDDLEKVEMSEVCSPLTEESEDYLVDVIVNAYHETTDLRELMGHAC